MGDHSRLQRSELAEHAEDAGDDVDLPVQSAARSTHVLVGWSTGSDDDVRLLASFPTGVRVTAIKMRELSPPLLSRLAPLDVALLRADLRWVERSALFHDPSLGFPEIVFVVDDAWSPERLAVESLGFRYVVTRHELRGWLPRVLPGLRAMAQARRAAMAAWANKPPPPGPPAPQKPCHRVTLHAAETRFRETYLRLLLAEHGSRRRAAAEAGVPYRSFCQMLRKLGI